MCTPQTINIQTFVEYAAVLIAPFTWAPPSPPPLSVTRIGRFNTIKTGMGWGGVQTKMAESGTTWKAFQRMAEWLPVNDVGTRVSTKMASVTLYVSPQNNAASFFFFYRHHRYSAWQMKAWFSLLSPKWLTDMRMGAQHASNGGIYSEQIKLCHLWVAIY